MRTTATNRVMEIISEYCTDSDESGLLKNLMFDAIESKLDVQRKQLTLNLLERLWRKGVGTNQVEDLVKNFKFGGGRVLSADKERQEKEKMIRRHMKDKVEDAKIQLVKVRHRQARVLNYLHSRVIQYDGLWRLFCEIQQCEVEEIWKEGVKKNQKKVEHLTSRWKPGRAQVERVWRGVLIGDVELEELRLKLGVEKEKEVPVYGGAQISDNLRALLKLPPGMTTYEKMDEIKFSEDLEAMMVKQRWEERNVEERDGEAWSEELEVKDAEGSEVKDGNNLDFGRKKATALPTNPRITLPKAVSEKREIEMRNMSERMKDVFKKYKSENCDEKGRVKMSNLKENEVRGLKEAQECGNVFNVTDKSKEFYVDTPENYLNSMKKHTDNDKVTDEKDQERLERELNGHGVMWARFLRVGEQWGHEARVKSAMQSKNGSIPKMKGMRKTHKDVIVGKEMEGPDQRPVCMAKRSPNGALSHLQSEILNAIADDLDEEVKTECRNTEEMLAALEKTNENENIVKMVVWSMDVIKLYPSLKSEEVSKLAAKAFMESSLEVEVDDIDLALYLALTVERKELVKLGLGRVTHTRKAARGAAPGITTAEVFAKQMREGNEEEADDEGMLGGPPSGGELRGSTQESASKSLFMLPERSPTVLQRRKMIGLALEVGIKAVMQGHMYQLDGKIHLQSEGGPIGLELSGALARVIMLIWDRELLQKLNRAAADTTWDLYTYLRYVDDGNCVAEEAPLGMRFERGKFIVKQDLIEEDKLVPGDKRTAELVAKVANSIFKFIQIETDFPSNHPNNMVPILDLKVCVVDNKISWQYYRKKVSNFLVLMERSAMSDRQKRVSLTQEVIRILRNTKKELPDSVKNDLLSEFSLRMMMSGYSEKFRMEVISSGVAGYEKQLARAEAGTCPLYRPKGYMKEERRKEKLIKKRSWYKPFSTVLFCPPSPGSQLAKELRKVAEEETRGKGWTVKVVERAGVKLAHQVPGLKEPTECKKEDCFIHISGGKGDCRKEGVMYKGSCLTCIEKGPSSEVNKEGEVVMLPAPPLAPPPLGKAHTKSKYFGESQFGGYTRGQQHLGALEKPKKHQENAFVRHREDYHLGEEESVRFRMDVVKCFNRPMDRQISEGCHILSPDADIMLNGKLDHMKPVVGRVVISTAVQSGRRRNRNPG